MTKRKLSVVRPWHILTAIVLVVAAAAVSLWFYLQNKTIAVLEPQGAIGMAERNLLIFTALLSLIVVIPVFIMLGTVAWRYREGNANAKYTPDADGNKWLETLWWGIPIVIITILGVVTVISTHQLDPYKALKSNVKPVNVQVIALQWKWLFLYPDQQVASINELKIPTGTPIHFDITADAPMSAFWIPSLGTQTYAMTGMNSQLNLEADNPGTYRGTNSNINGAGYADMAFKVTAESPRDFGLWANAIIDNKDHDHLDWGDFQDLEKPGTEVQPSYYHLHDLSLYNQVLAKYNGNGSMSNMNMSNGGGE